MADGLLALCRRAPYRLAHRRADGRLLSDLAAADVAVIIAHHLIGEIIGDAERRMDIARCVSAESIRTVLRLDSKLPCQVRLDFLERDPTRVALTSAAGPL